MQFDVCANLNEDTKASIPFLLDLQANLLSQLATRIVAPLMLVKHAAKNIQHLQPAFVIDGKKVILLTNEMAGVPVSILGRKVTSLLNERQTILSAIDFLFTGV